MEKIPLSENKTPQEKTREKVAKTFGTNSSYVSKAKKVKEYKPELLEEIKTGNTTLKDASSENSLMSIPQLKSCNPLSGLGCG